MSKADVRVLATREVERLYIIVADVTINGITKKKQFSVDKKLNDVEIVEKISDMIKEDKKNERSGFAVSSFEVQL